MMEWYWIYLIIGTCLYILGSAIDAIKIEANGLLHRIITVLSFILCWPKVIYVILEFLLITWLEARNKGRNVK